MQWSGVGSATRCGIEMSMHVEISVGSSNTVLPMHGVDHPFSKKCSPCSERRPWLCAHEVKSPQSHFSDACISSTMVFHGLYDIYFIDNPIGTTFLFSHRGH